MRSTQTALQVYMLGMYRVGYCVRTCDLVVFGTTPTVHVDSETMISAKSLSCKKVRLRLD